MEQNDKKKRSANFSEKEIELLCHLATKYAEIIESKKTDAHTWKDKNQAWEKLTAEFNLKNTVSVLRTLHNLKSKYESIKKDLRKKVSRNKQEMFRTGGGVPNITPLTPYEEQIYNLITLSVEGLSPRYDNDSIFSQEPKDILTDDILNDTPDDILNQVESENIEEIYIEWENTDNSETTQVESETPKKRSKMNSTYSTYTKPVSPSILSFRRVQEEVMNCQKGNTNLASTSRKDINTLENKENTKSPTIHAKWNPTLLRQSTSKALNVKKKNLLTKMQAAEKVCLLSNAKKDLAEVQINYFEKELIFQDREHNLKLLKAEQELRNAQLDGEIKEIEKNIKEQTLKKMINTNIFSI